MRWSSTASSSGLPREMALPTMTRSGRGSRLCSVNGSATVNAEAAQQVGHRRVRGLVGAGDAVALELKQSRERGHGRAADSDKVDVLCFP